MAAGEQLAEIEPGDVLQHAAAGVDHLAASVDRPHSQDMIAHRTPGDAAWTGDIGSDRAAERLPRAIVWFGDDVLTVLRERCLDLGERRAGSGGNDQFVR